MTQLIGEIKRLERTWPDLDAQIGNALRSIGTAMSGPGLLRDIGFQIAERAPDLQRRLDLIIATQKIGLDKGIVWADESLWVSHSPAGGAAVAKSLADKLRQAWKQRDFSDKAATAEVLDLLAKHQQDPYFAVAFANEMRPRELKALLADFHRFSQGNPHSRDWKDPPSTDVDRLAAALSVALGTASRGVGDMRLPKGYTDELVANQDEALTGLVVNRLLQHGVFDDAFVRDLTNKVYDNTQKPPGERQPMMGFGPGIAAALANNPRVAQDFFTDPTRKPLAFLMQQNRWSGGNHEVGRAIEAATMTYRDNGQPPGTSRGYKSALIASWAVHFWADRKAHKTLPDTKQSAARVFAAYIGDVHRIADDEVKESMGVTAKPDADPNLPGKQPYGATFERDDVKAAMTWAFSDDKAFKTVAEAHGEYSQMVLDAQAAQIKRSVESDLAAWHDSHPQASDAEMDVQRQKLIESRMSGSSSQEFNARVFDLSNSLYLIADAGNVANINEADRNDKNNEALKDAVTRTLKLTLTPAGQWTAPTFEFIESYVSDGIEFNEGEKARRDAVTATDMTQNMFRDITAGAMMRHGLFGDSSVPAVTHPYAHENYAKGSAGDFLKDGQIIPRSAMTTAQEHAYIEWLKHSPASRVFHATDLSFRAGFRLRTPTYPEARE
ncbi:hypothetical protein [Nonomuraea ceibae]|uniref:hypothetical protein n=1 Tax=Nonomuraea ceibae TaxID=1935170 RepID=UPI001C5D5655|nr:hypothetical protein [Nonomuraea ceibae]